MEKSPLVIASVFRESEEEKTHAKQKESWKLKRVTSSWRTFSQITSLIHETYDLLISRCSFGATSSSPSEMSSPPHQQLYGLRHQSITTAARKVTRNEEISSAVAPVAIAVHDCCQRRKMKGSAKVVGERKTKKDEEIDILVFFQKIEKKFTEKFQFLSEKEPITRN